MILWKSQIAFVFWILLMISNCSAIQANANDKADRSAYLLISTNQTKQLQKELNEKAQQGWRLAQLAREWDGNTLNAVMMLSPQPNMLFEYQVLATRRTAILTKELTKAAARGYELRGSLSLYRPVDYALSSTFGIGGETVLVLERPANQITPRFTYLLHSTVRQKTLEREINESAQKGYIPVDVLRGQESSLLRTALNTGVTVASYGVNQFIGAASWVTSPAVFTVILARSLTGACRESTQYRFLATSRTQTLERQLNQAAQEGFRLKIAAPGLAALLEKVNASQPTEYKLISLLKTDAIEERMMKEGQQGWHYLGLSSATRGVTVLLARTSAPLTSSASITYRVLSAWREKSLQKQLNELNDNYGLAGFGLVLFHPVVVLELRQQ